jgi:hypothetical protein
MKNPTLRQLNDRVVMRLGPVTGGHGDLAEEQHLRPDSLRADARCVDGSLLAAIGLPVGVGPRRASVSILPRCSSQDCRLMTPG